MKLTETEKTHTEKATYNSEDIREAFKHTEIQGFQLVGMDAHTYSICFQHIDLGIRINVCPECCMGNNEDAPQQLRIQLSGVYETAFENLEHQQKTYDYKNELRPETVQLRIERFIEEELQQ